jgi:hypothetical protein
VENTLEAVENTLNDLQQDYDELKEDYEDLKDDVGDVECKYAKSVCDPMEYYYMRNSEIICCFRNDAELCIETPENSDAIKEIDC